MFILLGDSHTRSYKIPTFIATRIFLAQGRKSNFFNSVNFTTTTFRYVRAAFKLKQSQFDYAFIIGEPDVRRLVYDRWDIGRSEEDILSSKRQLDVGEIRIDRLCAKVKLFLFITRCLNCKPTLIIGSGTPNPEMISASTTFNQKLAITCEKSNCLFFDPQSHAMSNDGKLLKPFLGYSVFNPSQKDHTHLSEAIGECLERFLYDSYQSKVVLSTNWSERVNFSRHFVEVKNFDTYKMKDLWFIPLLRRAKRSLVGRTS